MDWRDNTTGIKEKLNYTLITENARQDVKIFAGFGPTEEKFKAHSYVLFISSQVFEKLLEATEANSEGMKVLNMPDLCPKTLRCILEFIYTDCTNLENEDTIDILHGAVKFKLTGLVALCVTKLTNEISSENVIRLYEEAGKMSIEELEQDAQTYILLNVADVFQQEQFLDISETSLCKLLAHDELQIEEVFLFNAIMKWGRSECQRCLLEDNVENLRQVLKTVVTHIRFPLMTNDEFSSIVVPTKILSTEQVTDVYNHLNLKSVDRENHIKPRQRIASSYEKISNGENLELSDTAVNSPLTIEAEPNHDAYIVSKPKHLTKETLVHYLKEITGKMTISGLFSEMHPFSHRKGLQIIQKIAGVQPGILTTLMPSYNDDVSEWDLFTDKIISNWNAGYLVRILWCYENHPLTQLEVLGISDRPKWKDLTVNDGYLNTEWKMQLDDIMPYLQKLQDAGVVVLFDILPSINRNTIWWRLRPGITGSLELYQLTHDYLSKHHGLLDCLLWVWSLHSDSDMTQLEGLWPGNDYVDIASVNMRDNELLDMDMYNRLSKVVGDTPLSMENLWMVPTPELLQIQPRWTLFSVNELFLNTEKYNTENNVNAIFQCPSVINRGNNDFFKTGHDQQ